jgi:hypothetical protein
VEQGWGGFFTRGASSLDEEVKPFKDFERDIVIMGHGNYGNRIAKDCGYTHSARTLARLPAKGGLPTDYGGKIICWSCFAGVSGVQLGTWRLPGFAASLSVHLKNRGYMNLSVWGSLWITTEIVSRTFYCRRNTTPQNVGTGRGTVAKLADMNSFRGGAPMTTPARW